MPAMHSLFVSGACLCTPPCALEGIQYCAMHRGDGILSLRLLFPPVHFDVKSKKTS